MSDWKIEDFKRWGELSDEQRADLSISLWDDKKFPISAKVRIVRHFKDVPDASPKFRDFIYDRLTAEKSTGIPGELSRISHHIKQYTPKVSEEQLPETIGARAFLENFATSPEAAIKWLKENRPDIKDPQWHNRRIIGRVAGAADFRPIDPEGFDWQDISDVGYDVGAGIGTGAAAMFGGGMGGFAAGAATEPLRHALGMAGGLEQDFDPMSMVVPTVTGVAIPLMGRAAGSLGGVASQKGGSYLSGELKRVPFLPGRQTMVKQLESLSKKSTPSPLDVAEKQWQSVLKKPKTRFPFSGAVTATGQSAANIYNPYADIYYQAPAGGGGGIPPRYQ